MHYLNGARYEGEFENGLKHGEGILFYKNGKTEKQRWVHDIQIVEEIT